MADIDPVVRHMLVCEDVQASADSPEKINVLGLVHTIRSREDPPFPLLHPGLCVYLQLTCRGSGEARIVAVHGDTDRPIFATPSHMLHFGTDPLAVLGVVFRIRGCPFPEAGLYWMQFRYKEKVIAQQPLLLR
jgi:hypothetical protein